MKAEGSVLTSSSRGGKNVYTLKHRKVCYSENGLRSVPIEKTIQHIEQFFLKSPFEIQFGFKKRRYPGIETAILKYHSPHGKMCDKHYSGKGLSRNQNFASACFEFFERYCSKMRSDDQIIEASYNEIIENAVNPSLFNIETGALYQPSKKIDWIWGYSLTRNVPVLVPSGLVFFPHFTSTDKRITCYSNSNGLAAGNNLEEAILHALLEVIERDQVIISEYNRLPIRRITSSTTPEICNSLISYLERKNFGVHLFSGTSDIPVPFVIAFLQHKKKPSICSVAYGCYPDPTLALERALTEAMQVLPPSVLHGDWLKSGAPRFYSSDTHNEIDFKLIPDISKSGLRENIETCLSILKEVDSEVIFVDLSIPEIPFPSVRVLATKLQNVLSLDPQNMSQRFFDVPVKLGIRKQPLLSSEIKIWPICGYNKTEHS